MWLWWAWLGRRRAVAIVSRRRRVRHCRRYVPSFLHCFTSYFSALELNFRTRHLSISLSICFFFFFPPLSWQSLTHALPIAAVTRANRLCFAFAMTSFGLCFILGVSSLITGIEVHYIRLAAQYATGKTEKPHLSVEKSCDGGGRAGWAVS